MQIFSMDYKEFANGSQLQKYQNQHDETINENFEIVCNEFLTLVKESEIFSDFSALIILTNELRNKLSESDKNFFLSTQIHYILINYFLNPTMIDYECHIFLPYVFVIIYESFEPEIDFFLNEAFLTQLIKEATTFPTDQNDNNSKKYQNKLLRTNKLLEKLIQNFPESFSFSNIISQYCNSIKNIHNFQILETLILITKLDQATFDICIQIYPLLKNIVERDNTHYLERTGFAQLCITLLQKGIPFQQYFFEQFEIPKLFQIFIEIDEFIDGRKDPTANSTEEITLFDFTDLGTEIFNIYIILLTLEKREMSEFVLNTIDQSFLLNTIVKLTDPFDICLCGFFIAACHFYQTIFISFPQSLNDVILDLIKLLFSLCDTSYKLKIEIIFTLSLFCCSEKSDLIPFLVQNELIKNIMSAIDENQKTIVFLRSLKVIVDYSIATNNQEIQGEIFQDSFCELMDNVIQKTEYEEIGNIWKSIIETRNNL